MSFFEDWKVDKNYEKHLITLTLHTKVKGNVLRPKTFYELKEIIESAEKDKNLWFVVIQSAGEDFSYGMDVEEIARLIEAPEEYYQVVLKELQQCLIALENCQMPILAKVKGRCVGAGFLIAICSDFRVVAENAIFGFPEVKLSMAVIMGTTRVVRLVGVPKTKDWMMTGRDIYVPELENLGVIFKSTPSKDLDDLVNHIIESFGKLPPKAMVANKNIINSYLQFNNDAFLEKELFEQQKLLSTNDFKEAIKSFQQKKKPVFKGE